MRSGTYRGVSDELTVEIRVDAAGPSPAVSGDINVRSTFVASFIATAPTVSDGMVSGRVQYRGNPRLFTGAIELKADDRGIGVFQLEVDLEGGFRDVIAGRAEWASSRLRKLTIEVDGLAGMPFFRSFKNGAGSQISIESAFATAGFDVQVIADPFQGGESDVAKDGFTYAELHRAMRERRNSPLPDRLQAHVFVANFLAGKNGKNVLGVMYDFGANDLNQRPREGVAIFGQHPLLSDPRVSLEEREREYVFTLVHEVGHALNMLHSFDKGRPAALSWMNYPHLFPLGTEAGPGHNGTPEFWAAFEQAFDDLELHHLRHATPREIASGGFDFGLYEEGASPIYLGGTTNPRLTQLGSNPLRQSPDVAINIKAEKSFYNLGEPVFIELVVGARGHVPVRVPDALDPSEGFVRFVIEWPDGHRERYAPPLRVCMRAPTALLAAGREPLTSHAIPLFLAARGPVFTVPGRYRVWAELAGVDGNKVAFADPLDITIVSPDLQTQRFAEKLWTTSGALEAIYLRHPLVDLRAWQEIADAAERFGLSNKPDNTTAAYLEFVAGIGWSRAFQFVDRSKAPTDPSRMVKRLKNVKPHGLPRSLRDRARAMLEEQRSAKSKVVVSSAKDLLRESIPPSGLFGEVGLDLPSEAPPNPVNPFIVVRTLKGKPSFADVVSWNIQHLHGSTKNGRVETIAEYMDTFRCDFWGLQETDSEAIEDLVAALNARGNLQYGFECVEGGGQQSSCIFRKDTTRVRKLVLPHGLFDGKVQVSEKKTGKKILKRVFERDPLLCEVRVIQGNSKAFDFRCAIVHTKSTDPKLKDTGTGMRQAASRALERWVATGLSEGGEKDFVVMGDMNAEEAKQGLEAFAKSKRMKLLSVGMRARHGTQGERGAITRFASGRLLDHIAITSDTMSFMPKGDEREQIIIRSDVSVKGFTKPMPGSKPGAFQQFKFSDHIPVAVRFIIDKDKD